MNIFHKLIFSGLDAVHMTLDKLFKSKRMNIFQPGFNIYFVQFTVYSYLTDTQAASFNILDTVGISTQVDPSY